MFGLLTNLITLPVDVATGVVRATGNVADAAVRPVRRAMEPITDPAEEALRELRRAMREAGLI